MITYKKFVLADYEDCLIVTDDKIAKLYNINGDNVYLLPQGEQAKSFAQVENLCKWFLSKKLQRDGHVAAVGGGSIGDAVGFACSVFKRGVKLTHLPTTLLAQIDSAIGGKTAIDLDGVKNAVGTFYNADTVVDVNFLKTLDDAQILSGKGELLKYCMLSSDIDSIYDGEVTEQVIRACGAFKLNLCNVDPYDRNERKKLNFGHTLGHAMELYYNIPHGHAVANGMYYETALAYKLGKCSKEYCEHWTKTIADAFDILPITSSVLATSVNDKKNNSLGVCFMLPTEFDESYIDLNKVEKLLCCD